jgi:hypothetical protein
MESDGMVINELGIKKHMEGSGRGLIRSIFLTLLWREGGNLQKKKTLNLDIRFSSLDLNPRPPEYDSGVQSLWATAFGEE